MILIEQELASHFPAAKINTNSINQNVSFCYHVAKFPKDRNWPKNFQVWLMCTYFRKYQDSEIVSRERLCSSRKCVRAKKESGENRVHLVFPALRL